MLLKVLAEEINKIPYHITAQFANNLDIYKKCKLGNRILNRMEVMVAHLYIYKEQIIVSIAGKVNPNRKSRVFRHDLGDTYQRLSIHDPELLDKIIYILNNIGDQHPFRASGL